MDMHYVEKARQLRSKGYNCAQAVACSFSEVVGLDEQVLFSMMEGFGGGMGGHQATCGALSGAVAIAGLVTSKGSVEGQTKALTYAKSKALVQAFEARCKSLVCKDLLGEETGVELHSCELCVEDAVLLVQEMLQNR
ncbi:MAG: C_GCAxxG_C_C family protein [Spirochaetales bacterium]|jgi:C_GCAxxG_C_C family probable redox protein|nr:C_GCAxxG_C_C family protein [Spirochaetales bacterium]